MRSWSSILTGKRIRPRHITELQLAVDDIDVQLESGSIGLPDQSGHAGEFLTTDGSAPSWDTPAGGGGGDVVDDTSPQLGGSLDLNGFTVGSATASDLTKLNSVTADATELSYVDGVTSPIQTQLDAKQASDSDLTTIAGLTATTNNFMQAKSSAWASRTPTQVTADLDAFAGDAGSGGTKGLVPAPQIGDALKYLTGDGTWSSVPGGFTSFTAAADSGSSQSITNGNTLTIAGGTGLDSVASATDTVTLNIDATVATLTGSQTLTNKTLTAPTMTAPVLGTPASGTLTNATGLPISGLVASTVTAIGVGSVELGHASDTTLSRSAAGRLAVEGVDVVLLSVAQTLTGKTLTSPVISSISNTGTLTLPTSTDTLVGKATTDTFTNKTFNANGTGNALSNVEVADFASGVVDTDLSTVSGSDDTLASAKAIRTAIDAKPQVMPRVGSGRRYSQRSLYGGSYGGISLGNNAVFAVPIPITKACTISGISAKVNTNAGTSAYLGIYADDGTEGPGTLLASGTVSTATTGVKSATGLSLVIATPRLVWGAIVPDNAGVAWAALNANVEYLGSDSSLNGAYILSKNVGSWTIPSTFPTTPDYWDGGSSLSPLVYVIIS